VADLPLVAEARREHEAVVSSDLQTVNKKGRKG